KELELEPTLALAFVQVVVALERGAAIGARHVARRKHLRFPNDRPSGELFLTMISAQPGRLCVTGAEVVESAGKTPRGGARLEQGRRGLNRRTSTSHGSSTSTGT